MCYIESMSDLHPTEKKLTTAQWITLLTQGHHWIDFKDEAATNSCCVLISNISDFNEGEMHFNAGEADLFLNFSRLKPEKEEIIRFAESYGYLGIGKKYFDTERNQEFYGESINDWVDEVKLIRECINWVLEIKKDDPIQIEKVVKRVDESNLYKRPMFANRKPADKTIYLKDEFSSRSDVIDIAKYILSAEISFNLRKNTDIVLWDTDRCVPTIDIRPTNLKGALWLQIHYTLLGEHAQLKSCEQCGTLMLLGGGVSDGRKRAKKDNTKTCSSACRAALSRKKSKATKTQTA
jgi:hypothetical protein